MAKRKGESYLGGHSVIRTNPDWGQIQQDIEERFGRSKEGRKLIKEIRAAGMSYEKAAAFLKRQQL